MYNLLPLFVDKLELCIMENQNADSIEIIMSITDRVGDYELLERKKGRYQEESRQLDLESSLTSIRHATRIQMRLY